MQNLLQWRCLLRGRFVRYVPTCKCHHLSASNKNIDLRLKSNEIRRKFVEYFIQKHDHLYVRSSPIKLESDFSMLLVNAGMNQFKPIFLGTVLPDSPMARYRRVVNSQKCIRVRGKHNDLDMVGEDGSHHTFFEMLGNWSFGDYFKKEACEMAWDLLTGPYGIPKERLFVTYFAGDQSLGLDADYECRDVWLQIGVPADRILPFGMKDNFWDMGNVGPCGPCTEIHYVHGTPNTNPKYLVNSGTPDVVEIWNLVFMQYERLANGSLKKLPVYHVDTGMGLERITAILQDSRSNYDTDLFQPLFSCIQRQANIRPYKGLFGNNDEAGVDRCYRIIADHARMFTVSMADGITPDSAFAGHSLRRIFWRAAHIAFQILKCPPGTLVKLVEPVITSLEEAYPELRENANKVIEVVGTEEDKFINHFGENIAEIYEIAEDIKGSKIFPEEKLVMLHFQGITEDILFETVKDLGFSFDVKEYEKLKILAKEKREQSRPVLSKKDTFLDQLSLDHLKSNGVPPTDDKYKYSYERKDSAYVFPEVEAKILALSKDKKFVNELNAGDSGIIILDKTNFYVESGGQPSDQGVIFIKDSSFEVQEIKFSHGYIQHYGKLISGSLQSSQNVKLKINEKHRFACMCNHSASHILSEALDVVLGDTKPRSFYSGPDHFRMDITLQKTLSMKEICETENIANSFISSSCPVNVEMIPLNKLSERENIKTMAGEVYPDPMRAIIMSNSDFTAAEACCGTHVKNTEDIGSILIVSQASRGQTSKTIKAISGKKAYEVKKFSEEQVVFFNSLSRQYEEIKYTNPPDDVLLGIEKQLRSIRTKMHEELFALSIRIELNNNIEQLQRTLKGIVKKKKKGEKKSKKVQRDQ